MNFKDFFAKAQSQNVISDIIISDFKKIETQKDLYKILNYYYIHLLANNSKDLKLFKILISNHFNLVENSLNDLILSIEPAHNLNSKIAVTQRKLFGNSALLLIEKYFNIRLINKINKDYFNKNLYTVLYDVLFVQSRKDFNMYKIIKGFTFLSYIINEGSRN
jgi:hypothetical protein